MRTAGSSGIARDSRQRAVRPWAWRSRRAWPAPRPCPAPVSSCSRQRRYSSSPRSQSATASSSGTLPLSSRSTICASSFSASSNFTGGSPLRTGNAGTSALWRLRRAYAADLADRAREAAFGQADVDLVARSQRRGGPDDRPFAADDRVAALERRERRERAQPRRRAIQCRRGGARRAAPTRAGGARPAETSRSRWRSTDRRAPRPRPARVRSSDDVSSARSGTTSRAAAVGVDALTSAARSQSGVSCSWPTALDDRHRAPGHRADDTLVAERQQVLEAAAAAGEDDDVDLGLRADRAQRLRDGRRRPRALHERLGDEHSRRREAGLDGDDDVSLGGGVVPGHEADPARDARQRPLALGREQPFRRELLLQPLERGQVLAQAEALDRERPQPQLALRLEQLRPPVDVHALAVRAGRAAARRTARAASAPATTDPSPASLSVKKTLCQRSCRRSSQISPSTQTVGSRCSQEPTPRLNAETV